MTELLQLIVGGVVIVVGFAAAVAYPQMQYRAVRELHGLWRGLSIVPIGFMAFVGVVTLVGLAQGSNLWPILLIFTAPLATMYLLLLRFVQRRAAKADTRR